MAAKLIDRRFHNIPGIFISFFFIVSLFEQQNPFETEY